MKRNYLHEMRYWSETRRFMKRGFRVRFGKSAHEHMHGGPVLHDKAKCFTCRKPLRLDWNINLADSRFIGPLRETFQNLERLPLYYCFNCPEATTYQVVSNTSVRCMDSEGTDGGDETPYMCETSVPAELPLKPLRLTPLPSAIDALMVLANEIDFEMLDASAQQQIAQFLGREVSMTSDFDISQFGGQLTLPQGQQENNCPNPRCPVKKLPYYLDGDDFRMKELAVVQQEAVAGFKWVYAPIHYHVCWVCGTLQGNFACG